MLRNKAFNHAILEARSEGEIRNEVSKAEGAARSYYVPLNREEVFSDLDTSESGLSEAEAAKRLAIAGANSIRRLEKGVWVAGKDFLRNMFLNLFAVLLWAGGAMAFVAGMSALGWAIFLVIFINAAFSFWQEYKAESAVEALSKLLPRKVIAIRDNRDVEVDAENIVPGDLIRLGEGDAIPADGRLISADDARVDNSVLTGESAPVYKLAEPVVDGSAFIWTEMPNLVFAGTTMISGAAVAVVTATGMDTEIGQVAYLTQAIKPEASPLQKELVRITRAVTAIAISLGVLFFLLGYGIAGLSFAESFIFAVGIIVANVPEGLLPTVSLSLAMGVERMAKKKAIVKKLSAVETLGCATVICTDKTGTLTQNRMFVQKIFVSGASIDVTGNGYDPIGRLLQNNEHLSEAALSSLGAHLLLTGGALCNNAAIKPPQSPFEKGGGSKEAGEWTITGDPTEGALLCVAVKSGLDLGALGKDLPRLAHLPFERIRKMMSTVHEARRKPEWMPPIETGRLIAFVKGAPNEIVRLCVKQFKHGGEAAFDDDAKAGVIKENDDIASTGLRVLAVAYKTVERADEYKADEVEAGLTFIGLIAMLDPPRPEVKQAVAECHCAGIRVVMVTGDYGLTAKAIAREAGIAHDARVITGEELTAMTHADLRRVLEKGECVFARVEPKDKLRVVSALQDNGEVVAATGDGVNDAPALKKADIGVAMGMRGSDAAKEAAEIVLVDDNFASIVDAIREGRAVYANIKKFVTYIFASNIPEIIPFIAFVIFKVPLALTVMQILAVDLGTDILPALALGKEPPEKGAMNRPPRPKGQRLLDLKTLLRAYLFLGPIEALLCMGGFFLAYWMRGWVPGEAFSVDASIYAAATTMTFAGIVASQIGNVFACRSEDASVFRIGFFTNRFLLASVAMEAALTLVLIHAPFIREVFGFGGLKAGEWALLASFPIILLMVEEARKAVFHGRKEKPLKTNPQTG
ncbi:MAG: cation-transporting P-type ATPase [Deltaproteobacteria bacterium]|nr:cation-transporting P-type ATPase [Deltaproteobacteria bacterium]